MDRAQEKVLRKITCISKTRLGHHQTDQIDLLGITFSMNVKKIPILNYNKVIIKARTLLKLEYKTLDPIKEDNGN